MTNCDISHQKKVEHGLQNKSTNILNFTIQNQQMTNCDISHPKKVEHGLQNKSTNIEVEPNILERNKSEMLF